ncbi:DUF1254 domain-containing protein [Paludisphaera borealis]|uniref:DUF1254 domain-containing protein n=1 Tax=Paludisphaera borealis TaxID=1387353 RepID=A0A1U7CMZ0_9BACT|nr:DUF1254 domain-containing protein [Paludisphaera borealis]APW60302.1 hypothetical protein BSF38_01770 [Paludisphaera borealis]
MKTHLSMVLSLALVVTIVPSRPVSADAPNAAPRLSEEELGELAVDAYVYAYPLVIMEASRRVGTNHAAPDPTTGMGAPVNQFAHKRTFPDATFTDVVRPNADTLYSSLWFDVTDEPLVIHVPDSGGRYYLLPMLDMWTDVFASPGKRTTGTGEQTFAIVGPSWQGELPPGVELLRAPTPYGWIIGRTQTNGVGDYANVHQFQNGLVATPLSAWGKPYTAPKGTVDPNAPKVAPVEWVAKLDAATYFALFADVLKTNPPHANDQPILARLARIGFKPGKSFDLNAAPPEIRSALSNAMQAGPRRIVAAIEHADPEVNRWRMIGNPIGTYGTAYLKRALIAFMGLGANTVEDAIYPSALVDSKGRPLDSAKNYMVRFAKDQIPPVRAFWSLTMYDERQLFTANPIHRFAIGDRDALKFDADGSLTLYIQRSSPGAEKEANWLPAPHQGSFSMNLRLYWPIAAALDGTWAPPVVEERE